MLLTQKHIESASVSYDAYCSIIDTCDGSVSSNVPYDTYSMPSKIYCVGDVNNFAIKNVSN